MQPDRTLMRVCLAVFIACLALALVAVVGAGPARALAHAVGMFLNEIELSTLGAAGLVTYGVVLLAGFRVLGVRLARPAKGAPAESDVPERSA